MLKKTIFAVLNPISHLLVTVGYIILIFMLKENIQLAVLFMVCVFDVIRSFTEKAYWSSIEDK